MHYKNKIWSFTTIKGYWLFMFETKWLWIQFDVFKKWEYGRPILGTKKDKFELRNWWSSSFHLPFMDLYWSITPKWWRKRLEWED